MVSILSNGNNDPVQDNRYSNVNWCVMLYNCWMIWNNFFVMNHIVFWQQRQNNFVCLFVCLHDVNIDLKFKHQLFLFIYLFFFENYHHNHPHYSFLFIRMKLREKNDNFFCSFICACENNENVCNVVVLKINQMMMMRIWQISIVSFRKKGWCSLFVLFLFCCSINQLYSFFSPG